MYEEYIIKNILKNAVCLSLSILKIDFERKEIKCNCVKNEYKMCYRMTFNFRDYNYCFDIKNNEINELTPDLVYKKITKECLTIIKKIDFMRNFELDEKEIIKLNELLKRYLKNNYDDSISAYDSINTLQNYIDSDITGKNCFS